MIKKKKAKKILKESFSEYKKDPRDWSFWISPRVSPPEVYLIHGNTAYFLKIDSLYTPNPIGIGAKFDVEEDQLPKNLPEYGFRQFSKNELKSLFGDLPSPFELESRKEFQEVAEEAGKKIRKGLAEKEPAPPPQTKKEGAVFLGPYHHGEPLEYVSDKQRDLKKELERELERLKQREHPGYA